MLPVARLYPSPKRSRRSSAVFADEAAIEVTWLWWQINYADLCARGHHSPLIPKVERVTASNNDHDRSCGLSCVSRAAMLRPSGSLKTENIGNHLVYIKRIFG